MFAVSPALADRVEHPVLFEIGINTRHFAAQQPGDSVAFRTIDPPPAGSPEGEAVTTSLRFTGRALWDTFVGVEAEAGALVGYPMSNLAGVYGVGGMRQELGPFRIGAELVAGRRWVRYELKNQRSDDGAWIAEPRVRADMWLTPRWTLGAAAGATLGERSVWMAGVYLGVNSADFGR